LINAKKRKRVRKNVKRKNLSIVVSEEALEPEEAAFPSVFVSADSKELAGGKLVSADSARLKMAAFSVRWERLVSADPKGAMGAICLQEGKRLGTAVSEGVRRTAWRARMVRRARRNRADLANQYNIVVPYVNDYL